MSRSYGGTSLERSIVGISIGREPEEVLRRGFGIEHLREMLRQVARPIVLHGASIAYGGSWEERPDNFTYDLLRLISAEKQDQQGAAIDSETDDLAPIGLLYNHLSWPGYLSVTPAIEAQWIDCCRIVRVTQEAAGFRPEEVVAGNARWHNAARTAFNSAVTMSAMRRQMMEPMRIDPSSHALPAVAAARNAPTRGRGRKPLRTAVQPVERSRMLHPVLARVVLGGRITGFAGAMPGIFEEALATLEKQRPLYVIGGFGGAAGVLARALLQPGRVRMAEFTTAFHAAHTSAYGQLLEAFHQFTAPAGAVKPEQALAGLWKLLQRKGGPLKAVLHNELTDDENRRLLETTDVREAGRLVLTGLQRVRKI